MDLTSKHKRGFTLMELLIVVGLMGLLFGALFGTYLGIQKALRKATRSSASEQSIDAVFSILLKDIGNLYYEEFSSETLFNGQKETVAGLRGDTLEFNTGRYYSSGSNRSFAVFTVHYVCEPSDDGNGLKLLRYQAPFVVPDNMRQHIALTSVPLHGSIQELSFRYAAEDKSFTDDWNFSEKKALPEFIEVKIIWLDDSQERELTTVIQPAIMSF